MWEFKNIKMKINLENILGWDIETAPKEDFTEDHPMYDTWANRNRKENLSMEELIEKFNKEGGLYGEYLNIVCISCAFIHEGEIRVNSFTGEEKDIIDGFLKVVAFMETRGKVISLGHNIQNYDIPVLRKVYSRYYPMFTFPNSISDINTTGFPIPEKPWILSEKILDTLQLQKGGNYMFSSMAETALNMGLKSPKQDTDGSMVAELVRNGEIGRVSSYCEGDVLKSFEILFRWMGQEMLPVAQKQQEVEIKQLSLLEKLYQQNSFTPEIKKGLEKLLNKKKITAKDKEGIKEIIYSVYVRTSFATNDEDKKEIKESKLKEVENFINTL